MEAFQRERYADVVRIVTHIYSEPAFIPVEIREKVWSSIKIGDIVLVLREWVIWNEEEERKPIEGLRRVKNLDVWEEIKRAQADPELGLHMFKKLGNYKEYFGTFKRAPNILKEAFEKKPFAVLDMNTANTIIDRLQQELRLPESELNGTWLIGARSLAVKRLAPKIWEYIKLEDIGSIGDEEMNKLCKAFDNEGGDRLNVNLSLRLLEDEGKTVWIEGEKRFGVPEIAEKRRSRTTIQVTIDFASLKSMISEKGLLLQVIECPNCKGKVPLPQTGNVTKCEHCGKDVYAVDVFEKFKGMLGLS